MLEFKNISVEKSKKTILDNVSLSCEKGRITVLIGKNGSGKTTLMRCAVNNVKYVGEILCDRINIGHVSSVDRARMISYMPQMLPKTNMSTYDVVSMGRNPYRAFSGSQRNDNNAIVMKSMEQSGILHLINRSCDHLSGGEMRRVLMSMVIAQRSEYILLDEPTSYLDSQSARWLYDTCATLREENKGILITIHNLSDAISIADDIVILDEGRVIFCGTKQDALASETIEKIFHVEKYVIDSNIFFK